jgi:Uma2 family endonuclease
MRTPTRENYLTVTDYLERDSSSSDKHEYWEGSIYPVGGGTPEHAQVIFNMMGVLGNNIRGRPFTGSSSAQRVKVDRTSFFTYPDVSISLPPMRFAFEDSDTLINPILLVEVSTLLTHDLDRTFKWDNYRQIPDLRDYLLISSSRVRVEHFHRDENDRWILWTGIERTSILQVPTLGLEIPLSEIYDGIDVVEGFTHQGNGS